MADMEDGMHWKAHKGIHSGHIIINCLLGGLGKNVGLDYRRTLAWAGLHALESSMGQQREGKETRH